MLTENILQSTITLRAYCNEDWPAICAIHDRARPYELDGSCDTQAFVSLAVEQEDIENFQRSEKFVACLGETVVGFVGVDDSLISWLYVDPAHFGQGIGRELLQLSLELTGPQAWTVVLAENTIARKLYESEGFQVIHTFDGSNAGYPCTCLEMALLACPNYSAVEHTWFSAA
ncbi:MAG: GNAT family N-acetyltransferase [Cyanobacteria bacterium P01_F01_bin.13]